MHEGGDENDARGASLNFWFSYKTRLDKVYRPGELTLNKRGGIMGERVVYISLTPPLKRQTNPSTNRTMVCGVDPRKEFYQRLRPYSIGKTYSLFDFH